MSTPDLHLRHHEARALDAPGRGRHALAVVHPVERRQSPLSRLLARVNAQPVAARGASASAA